RVRRRARGCGVLPGVRVSTVCLWGGWVWGVLLVAGMRGLLRIWLLGVGSWLWGSVGAGLLVSARVRRLVVVRGRWTVPAGPVRRGWWLSLPLLRGLRGHGGFRIV